MELEPGKKQDQERAPVQMGGIFVAFKALYLLAIS
jgi:hypothetical protein